MNPSSTSGVASRLSAAVLSDGEGEFQVLGVRLVDLVERRIALGIEIVMVHQPILRLGIEQALIGHVGGAHRRCAGCQCRHDDAERR